MVTSLSYDWLVITASELPPLPQFVTFLTEIFADSECPASGNESTF